MMAGEIPPTLLRACGLLNAGWRWAGDNAATASPLARRSSSGSLADGFDEVEEGSVGDGDGDATRGGEAGEAGGCLPSRSAFNVSI